MQMAEALEASPEAEQAVEAEEPNTDEQAAMQAAAATPLGDTAGEEKVPPPSATDEVEVGPTQGAAGVTATDTTDCPTAAATPGPPPPTASGEEQAQAPVSEDPGPSPQAALPAQLLLSEAPVQRPPPGLEGLALGGAAVQETPAEAQQSQKAPQEEQPAANQQQVVEQAAAPDNQPGNEAAAAATGSTACWAGGGEGAQPWSGQGGLGDQPWAAQSDGMAQWIGQDANGCDPNWSAGSGDGQNWGVQAAEQQWGENWQADQQFGENWQTDQQWSGQEWMQNQQEWAADMAGQWQEQPSTNVEDVAAAAASAEAAQHQHEQEWQQAHEMYRYQAQLAVVSGTELAGYGQEWATAEAAQHQEQVPAETQQPEWKQHAQTPLPASFQAPQAVDMLPPLKLGFGEVLKAERTLEHREDLEKKKAEGRETRIKEIDKLVDLDLEWLLENIADVHKAWGTICEGVDAALSVEEEIRKIQAPRVETSTLEPASNPWADMTEEAEDTKEQEGQGQLWWRRCRDEAKKVDDWSQWGRNEWGPADTADTWDSGYRADNNYQSHSSTHRGWESNGWDDKAWDTSYDSTNNGWEKPAQKAVSGQSSGNPWADMTSDQDQSWHASSDVGNNANASWQEDTWQDGWQQSAAGDSAWKQGSDSWKEPSHQGGRWPDSNAGNSIPRHPGDGANGLAGSGDSWGAWAGGVAGSGDTWGAGASGVAASYDAWSTGTGPSGAAGLGDAWGAGADDGRSRLVGGHPGPPSSSRPLSGSSEPRIPGRQPAAAMNQVNARNPQGCLGSSPSVRQPVGLPLHHVNGPGNAAAPTSSRLPAGTDPWTQGCDPWGSAPARRQAVKTGPQLKEEANPWSGMQHQ